MTLMRSRSSAGYHQQHQQSPKKNVISSSSTSAASPIPIRASISSSSSQSSLSSVSSHFSIASFRNSSTSNTQSYKLPTRSYRDLPTNNNNNNNNIQSSSVSLSSSTSQLKMVTADDERNKLSYTHKSSIPSPLQVPPNSGNNKSNNPIKLFQMRVSVGIQQYLNNNNNNQQQQQQQQLQKQRKSFTPWALIRFLIAIMVSYISFRMWITSTYDVYSSMSTSRSTTTTTGNLILPDVMTIANNNNPSSDIDQQMQRIANDIPKTSVTDTTDTTDREATRTNEIQDAQIATDNNNDHVTNTEDNVIPKTVDVMIVSNDNNDNNPFFEEQHQQQNHQQHYPLSTTNTIQIATDVASATHTDTANGGTPPIGFIINGAYLPQQFAIDRHIIENTEYNYKYKPFPRWESNSMIVDHTARDTVPMIESIIDFVKEQSLMFTEFQKEDNGEVQAIGPSYWKRMLYWVHTSDHLRKDNVVNWWQPEILYIIDASSNNIYTSSYAKDLADRNTKSLQWKVNPTEDLMKHALSLPFDAEHAKLRWPRLHKLLVIDKGSFPFLTHFCDYTGCNKGNWKNGTQSVPLFTVAASADCNHSYPFPNYRTYLHAKTDLQHWNVILDELYSPPHFPQWIEKIPQAIWRGRLTGRMPLNPLERSPRWHLLYNVHSPHSTYTIEQRAMFDVRMTQVPLPVQKLPYINIDELGGANENHEIQMIDFQRYRAIIDVDGHSWSSRFGDVICYTSVVIKVEPEFVDYFYFGVNRHDISHDDDETKIVPWKHYIPVKSDLSDLVEKVQYALADENHQHIERIIQNAQYWCKHNMIQTKMAHDVLDIWEHYINTLDESSSSSSSSQSNSNTWEELWAIEKNKILHPSSSQLMISVV